ncbi:MAG TPA: hypothetical protein VLG93_08720 [Sulfuricaulis sp.]|nr:hypothetical protein [Sulfuricaulis sp.]
MKALLIDPENRSLEPIDIQGSEDIAKLIGYDTIESDAVGTAGDRLYFDEECFLRGTQGRFQIDSVIPVSGKAVLIGTSDAGKTLRDVATDIDSLRSRLKYL